MDLASQIDRIYGAAMAPERWPVFLDGLRSELQLATLGLIFRHPSDGDHGIIASAGNDEHYDHTYRSHFYKLNPWLPWGPLEEEGRVILADSVLPQSELVRTEFYNDWMRPQGLGHLFTAFLCNPGPREPLAELGGLRAKRVGPLEEEDLDLVHTLVPHLQRSLSIHARVQGAEMRAGAAAEALDRIVGGVILLDEQGAPLLTNRTADQILAANDGLFLDREGPSASSPRQTGELRGLLSNAAATGAGKGVGAGGVMRLARPSGGPALEVVVTPVRRGASPMFACNAAAAAIFVADPEARAERPPERLRRVYGLTPKEAEVASRLAGGMSPSQISDALGVTIHTVRGHLKQLFAKTDTRRQAELVRALLSGLASIRLE
jgi:DNA-binding CsgD family transcriptional regulator/PAS domain-containing protein